MHELPWDFWCLMDQSWKVLFNNLTGFEIIGTEMNIPCSIIPDDWHPNWKPEDWKGFVNSNLLARKIGDFDHERLKKDLSIDDILDSIYPH